MFAQLLSVSTMTGVPLNEDTITRSITRGGKAMLPKKVSAHTGKTAASASAGPTVMATQGGNAGFSELKKLLSELEVFPS